MTIRPVTRSDLPFLEAMQFEAFFWDPAWSRPRLVDFRTDPEFVKLVSGWGRDGDRGVLAEVDGVRAGAAWCRLWTPDLHSYGFVDERTPELAMGVASAFRRRGIGRALLRELVGIARAAGFPALSLSVDPRNPALRLYESEGFRRVGESGTSWTLALPLRST